ncbi:MAG: AAA family ATPase [Thermoplasmata archaeon]
MILTALNNQSVQDSFKKHYPDIQFATNDLCTQDELLEALKNIKPQVLILSDSLDGYLDKYKLIESIRGISNDLKIILIAREENKEYINWLAAKAIYDVFIDGQCTFDDIYTAIINKDNVKVKVEKQIIEKEKIVYKDRIIREKELVTVNFKRIILAVWDNAEFGCELAYMAARMTNYKVLLVDLDMLSPKADLILKIKPSELNQDKGLNAILDNLQRNIFDMNSFYESCTRLLDNLYVVTGNCDLKNYEYYTDDSIHKLLDKAYQNFDITLLLINRCIYDLATLISLTKSDYNIIAIKPDIVSIREFKNYISFLNDKQQIDDKKFLFATYEYSKNNSLTPDVIKAVVKNYIGKVQYSKHRDKMRSSKALFIKRKFKEVSEDYINIMSYFNIVPKKSFILRVLHKSAQKITFLKRLIKKGGRRIAAG